LGATEKRGVLAEMCSPIASAHPELPREKLLSVLEERERLGSTGIGEGVAIPHGKLPGLPGLLASFGRSVGGVDFEAIDGRPTHPFFTLFAPENAAGVPLKALARISRLFKNASFRSAIMAAPDAASIYRLITEEDAKY